MTMITPTKNAIGRTVARSCTTSGGSLLPPGIASPGKRALFRVVIGPSALQDEEWIMQDDTTPEPIKTQAAGGYEEGPKTFPQ